MNSADCFSIEVCPWQAAKAQDTRDSEARAAVQARTAQMLRAAEQALLQEKMEALLHEDVNAEAEAPKTDQGPEASAGSEESSNALQLLGLTSGADRNAIR